MSVERWSIESKPKKKETDFVKFRSIIIRSRHTHAQKIKLKMQMTAAGRQ